MATNVSAIFALPASSIITVSNLKLLSLNILSPLMPIHVAKTTSTELYIIG